MKFLRSLSLKQVYNLYVCRKFLDNVGPLTKAEMGPEKSASEYVQEVISGNTSSEKLDVSFKLKISICKQIYLVANWWLNVK